MTHLASYRELQILEKNIMGDSPSKKLKKTDILKITIGTV